MDLVLISGNYQCTQERGNGLIPSYLSVKDGHLLCYSLTFKGNMALKDTKQEIEYLKKT